MTKRPWEVPGVPWKTEGAFWSWVRGVLRKGWSRHPVKIEYINLHRKRIRNPSAQSRKRFPEVWGMTCQICGKDHVQKNIEIDHRGDNAKFTGLEDAKSYLQHLFLVDFDSLRELCKPCHKVISHAQNTGQTFEEAALDKKVIAFMKLPKKEILAFLQQHNYNGDSVSNNEKRKLLVYNIFKQEEQNG